MNFWAKNFTKEALDLFSQIMVLDPSKRIHAIDALKHPYFNDLEKNLYEKHNEY